MLSCPFLVALLLSCSVGALDLDEPRTVVAFVGEAVVLPCHTSVSNDLPTVEWLKEGLDPNIVFLYRQGCETHDMKNQAFWYRSNLIMSELKNGNISLRISPVQLSDAGRYKCRTIRKKPQTNAVVELRVVAVSEPKLSVIPAGGGGLTLQCKVSCWFQMPVITFLNDHGDNIGGDDLKYILSEDSQHSQDPGKCFDIWRRVTVQTPVRRVICKVHQPSRNQTRITEIYITDDSMRSCTESISITAVVTAALLGSVLCAVCLCKKFRKSTGGPKMTISGQTLADQSPTDRDTDGYPQPGNLADAAGGQSAEHQRSIEELRQTIGAKDETIQTLRLELDELKSRQTPDVSDSRSAESITSPSLDGSAPGVSIQGTHSSSPALLDDGGDELPSSLPAFSTDEKHVFRSMSLSGPYYSPSKKRAKPQRRYTTAAMARNRLSLSKFPEDEVQELLKEKPDQVN